jgi:hypothetical protein
VGATRAQAAAQRDADADVAVAVPVGDGRTLLALADDQDGPPAVVSLWDPATAEKVGGPLTYPAQAVEAMIALPAPDGTALLAVAYQDVDGSLMQVWDPVVGERVGEPLPGPLDGSGPAAVPGAGRPSPAGRHRGVRRRAATLGSGHRRAGARSTWDQLGARSWTPGPSRPRPRRTAARCC